MEGDISDLFILSQVSGCQGHGGSEQTMGCWHTLTLGFTETQKGLSNALCQGWEYGSEPPDTADAWVHLGLQGRMARSVLNKQAAQPQTTWAPGLWGQGADRNWLREFCLSQGKNGVAPALPSAGPMPPLCPGDRKWQGLVLGG